MEKKKAVTNKNKRNRCVFCALDIKSSKYYIIKWLTDYITEYGIDGYRGDTVKHTDETVWADFKTNVITHLKLGKKTIQQSIRQQFLYTIAEVYNYGISGGQDFDFGDKKVTISKWFQQHDQFRIQMGCPEDYEFIF
jgi:alpha-amylase